MRKQQEATGGQQYSQFPLSKRVTLITALLCSGGLLTTLVPSQATYAHSSSPSASHHTTHKEYGESVKLLVVCKAGNGGKGGSATRSSSGAAGGAGGNCIITIPPNVILTIQDNDH